MATQPNIIDFLWQLDALKAVERRSYIQGGARLENSAEHSWHLAMACWAFAEHLQDDFDLLKLLQLALVHDIGEIGAGDTFLYDSARREAHAQERNYIATLAEHPGCTLPLLTTWDEQEHGRSKEAQLLKVLDRLLPFLLNMQSGGQAWIDNGVKRSQVKAAHAFVAEDYPEIYAWFSKNVEQAVAQGWLIDDSV
ncbi:MAG: HD domain-containing protein [Gammaproteobacteria bacterium]|nr:HD domain-containing protein [Gammaproteobacteria bacterium]